MKNILLLMLVVLGVMGCGSTSLNKALTHPQRLGNISAETHGIHDTTHWVLENGIEVIYKREAQAGDNVRIAMTAIGGKAVLPSSLLPASNVFVEVASRSGLGRLGGAELDQFLRYKGIEVYPYIDYTYHGIELETKPGALADAFAVLYHSIVHPRFEPSMLSSIAHRYQKEAIEQESTVIGRINEQVTQNILEPGSYFDVIPPSAYPKVALHELEYVHAQLFGQNLGFKVVVVGDLAPSLIKPFIQQYVASLPIEPAVATSTRLSLNADYQPRLNVEGYDKNKAFYILDISAERDEPRLPKAVFAEEMLQHIAAQRVKKKVRETLGLGYSPRVLFFGQDSGGADLWQFHISVEPDDLPRIEKALDDIVNSLLKDISQKERDTAVEQIVSRWKDLELDLREYTWQLLRYWTHYGDLSAMLKRETTASSVSRDDLKQLAEHVFGDKAKQVKITVQAKEG